MVVTRKAKRLRTSRKKSKLLKKVENPSLFQFSDLNDDCLIYLFKGMNTISLANMCRTCKRFYRIITKYIIPFRTIDFSLCNTTCSVREMFALFGKSMTRIVVHQDLFPRLTDFDDFCHMLIQYGQPGKLKDVVLIFDDYFNDVPANIIGPYFANVQRLEFNFIGYQMLPDEDFIEFIEAIDTQNLRELRVNNVVLIGEWFSAELFPNVQKIHLSIFQTNFDAENESRMVQFISNKPASLIEFECLGAPSNEIFVVLSQHNPEIERLGEIKYWPNDATLDDNGVHNKWKYLNGLTNLKDVRLRSSTVDFSDMGEVFSILAKRQTIEHMQLTFGLNNQHRNDPVQIADLKRLSRLKTLNLLNFNDNRSKEFVNLLFVNLPALTSCTIDGKHPNQGRIIELIKFAPNLKVLKFNRKFKMFSKQFYEKLVKCRTPSGGQAAHDDNRIMIYIDGDNVKKCVKSLGKRGYKPSIIMLRSI